MSFPTDPLGHAGGDASAPAVLVVDDDPCGARTTAAVLADGGYRVLAECDGDAVLALVRGSFLRVVVSELYVPCTAAACVVTALTSERHRLPRLRVLVHSRHDAPGDVAWALAAGCDAVVAKSARPGALLREVQRLDRAAPGAWGPHS